MLGLLLLDFFGLTALQFCILGSLQGQSLQPSSWEGIGGVPVPFLPQTIVGTSPFPQSSLQFPTFSLELLSPESFSLFTTKKASILNQHYKHIPTAHMQKELFTGPYKGSKKHLRIKSIWFNFLSTTEVLWLSHPFFIPRILLIPMVSSPP